MWLFAVCAGAAVGCMGCVLPPPAPSWEVSIVLLIVPAVNTPAHIEQLLGGCVEGGGGRLWLWDRCVTAEHILVIQQVAE